MDTMPNESSAPKEADDKATSPAADARIYAEMANRIRDISTMADVELKQRRELVRQEIAKVLMRQTPAFVRIWEMERDQRTAFKEALDAQIAKEKFAGLFLNEYLAILVSIGIDERDVTVMVDVLKRFQSFGRELDEILDRYTNLKETNSKAAAEGFDKLCETLATVAEEHYHRRRGRG